MALSIETGAGVQGATSYVTLAELRSYAALRGVTLPADAALEVLAVKATDYLEAKRDKYIGAKVNGQGYLQWPRKQDDGTGVVIDAVQLDTLTIPVELKNAQCQAVCDLTVLGDLMPNADGPAVKSESVQGAVATVYAVVDGDRSLTPKLRKVEAILAPLYMSGLSFRSVRV